MVYINFNKSASEPLYIQAFNQLALKINHGEIKSGSKLPSQRQMADWHNVSVNTITNAYNMLIQYGYASSYERSGYFVNEIRDKNNNEPERSWRSNVPCVYNFSRNGLDLTMSTAFKKVYRQCVKYYTDAGFGYPDYNGSYDVRKQICSMLNKTHGIICDPIQIILGASVEQLLSSLLRVLGCDLVFGMENPAYNKVAQYINLGSQKIEYLNIGEDGITRKGLQGFDADILFLMPFHHYPLYYKMTKDQKRTVLDWAGSKRYIIEYGYDMDFVYENPSEPMFSMTRDKNVIFIGDFIRTVAPSINLSYAVLPERLLNKWQKVYYTYHSSVSPIEQAFIGEIIRNASYFSNIKRLRRIYRNKQRLLIDTLKKHSFGDKIEILNAECGTTVIVKPKLDFSEETLIDIAHENGVKLSYIKNALEQPNSEIPLNLFILGCGELSNDDIQNGAVKLMDTWQSLV